MSWLITGVLALIVGLIVWTEMRCARRNRAFHAHFDPEVDALKDSVMTKYRERFGKDPTAQFPVVEAPKTHRRFAAKKS
jgi:hypothetical protein